MKYPVAIAIGVATFLALSAVTFVLWDEARRSPLPEGPQVNAVDFDEVRLARELSREGTTDRDDGIDIPPSQAAQARAPSAPRTRDRAAVAPDLEPDPLEIGSIRTVDLEKTRRDLVGVERVRTTILSDDAFRSTVDRWDAPDDCARDSVGAQALALTFTIAPSGDVVSARAGEVDGAAERRVASCMIARVGALAFPRTDSDTAYEREATFVF